MQIKPEVAHLYPRSQKEWWDWLEKNHEREDSVWLIFHKKNSPGFNLTYQDALDSALCFGWIDSTVKRIDEHSRRQYFSKRRPGSTWSAKNKKTVGELLEKNLMRKAGLRCIEVAKENGSYYILDSVNALEIPEDLAAAFSHNPKAFSRYESLDLRGRRMILYRLAMVKTKQGRDRNIAKILAELDG